MNVNLINYFKSKLPAFKKCQLKCQFTEKMLMTPLNESIQTVRNSMRWMTYFLQFFLTFLVQLVFHVCVFVCVCFHVHTSVLCCMCEGQKTTGNKIGSFFPLCRFWHLNSFYQALQQAVLYTIASDFPTRSSDRSQMIDKSQSVEVYHIQEIWHADILLDEMM